MHEVSQSDYTETQFVSFIRELFAANSSGTSDEVMTDLLDQFCEITGQSADSAGFAA